MSITFRPHHFLCALCFQGKGYHAAFIKNFSHILHQLNAETDYSTITITQHTDSICAPCPHKRNTACTSQDKIVDLDTAHATALDFHPGDEITWDEAKKQIRAHLTLEKFHSICAPCEWKPYGICEAVIKKFLD